MTKRIDLIVAQKSSFEITIDLDNCDQTELDLTGYEVVAGYTDPDLNTNSVIKNFTVNVFSPTTGEFTISLTPEQTTLMTSRKYVYDICTVSSSGFKKRIIEGSINVTQGVI